MKIAVIGSGIAGLSAALLLDKDHDVYLIEKDSRLGGHANTVTIEKEDGTIAVDTGFIVYNERNYPLFTKLLNHLGVSSRPTEMSFSVSDKLLGFEFRPTGFRTLFPAFANLANFPFLYMLSEIPRFNYSVKKAVPTQLSLGEFIRKHRFSSFFSKYYVTPLASSIWSSSISDILTMPLNVFANFMGNHGLISFGNQPEWRTIPGGSVQYVQAIAASLKNAPRTGAEITSIERRGEKAVLRYRSGSEEEFGAVFMATHADTALGLLKNPTAGEKKALSRFRFSKNKAVLHSDDSLLPAHHAVRGSWNFHVLQNSAQEVTISYLMNKLQPLKSNSDILISLGMEKYIKEDCVIDSFDYEHPVLDQNAVTGQNEIEALQGENRTYYAGAWLGYGFHEDGIRSAYRAIKVFYDRHPGGTGSFLD